MASDYNPIARPYARAVFQLARDNGELEGWSETLDLLAAVAGDDDVHALLASPGLSPDQAEQLILDIIGGYLGDAGRSLVHQLAANRRLIAAPALAEQYRDLRATEEGTLDARLIAADAVDDATRQKLEEGLGKRLQRRVRLVSETDKTLLGGAVIRAGDLVIDGSVRGRLNRLATALNR
ncbi:MAG: F0F1 ATP synthase subunit delta [Ectothiorhodospiraceae bacterium]